MATKSKTKDDGDAPLIDLNEASVKKLIAKAKKKGYVTYDELNDALPQGEMSSDQIEDIQSALSDMGVQIVESDEDAEAAAEEADEVEEITTDTKKDSKAAAKPAAKRPQPENARTIRCACICAKWVRSNCSAAKVKSPSPSGSKPDAT